jgi:hypothetical protein
VTRVQNGIEPRKYLSGASVDPTEAPYVPINDSAVEDALRPVVVARKHCLHPGSERGGRTAAMPMSLLQSGRWPGNAPHA